MNVLLKNKNRKTPIWQQSLTERELEYFILHVVKFKNFYNLDILCFV